MIEGNTGKWEIVIGLEIHAQVKSNTKLFSGAATTFGASPNSQVSLIDAAMPGMLPVINEVCIKQAVKTGLGLNAKINLNSRFDRKNYFYPDLPQGYQISQFYEPIVENGHIKINTENGEKTIRIERLHLEQDAGKSLHEHSPNYTYIDLNRSGIALMEIVTKPDLRTPEEANEFLKKLRSILRYLGTCDGDMEKGSMRCDANVSVRKLGTEKLGTRCEIKNLNSTRNIAKAIQYEAERQVAVLEQGGVIDQETRLYDTHKNETRVMRSKEDALDYRYFPDPDLMPVKINQDYIEQIKLTMPELPDAKSARYIKDFGLSEYDASVLTSEKEISDYYEELVKVADAKLAANWLSIELFGRLNKLNLSISESPIKPTDLIGLIKQIENNTISGKIAKDILDIMIETNKSALDIIEEKGLKQITSPDQLIPVIETIIAANQDKVNEYRSGKDKLFGFFVGQVMKQTEGKANPDLVNQLLKEKLV